jgi:hypothetical protein
LGPVFVKFGQLLSTRRDLLPLDIADELALLQDQVAPFPANEAIQRIEQALGSPLMTASPNLMLIRWPLHQWHRFMVLDLQTAPMLL